MRGSIGVSKVIACAVWLAVGGCSVYSGGGGGGDSGPVDGDGPPIPTGPPSDAEQRLQALLQQAYPTGVMVAGPGTDDSVVLAAPADPLKRAPLTSGAPLSVGIDFTAQSPVTAICVGFGSPNNALCVPTGAPGIVQSGSPTQGAIGLTLPVPADLCAMLSSICHDIRCYEFAQTDAGTFSAANIHLLASACGNCDEPSCQELLDSCVVGCEPACMGGQTCVDGVCVAEGALRFTLTWSTPGTDLDLHVVSPLGGEIWFSNPVQDGGELDTDNTEGGAGAVENVHFPGTPPAGSYTYFVDNFAGGDADFTLTAYVNGTAVATQSGTAAADGQSPHYTLGYP